MTLSHLRRLLEPNRAASEACFCVRSDLRRVWLHRAPALVVDLWQLRSRLARARAAREAGDLVTVGIQLAAAHGLWRGRALPDLERIPDVGAAVAEVDALRLTVLLELGELRLRTGRADDAGRLATAALALDEFAEPAHRLAMAAALARGDAAERIAPPGGPWRRAASWAYLLRPRPACCSGGRCASYPPPGGPSALPDPGPQAVLTVRFARSQVTPQQQEGYLGGSGVVGRGIAMSWRWPAMSLPE